MTTDDKKERVQRIPTEIFTEGDLDLIDEIFADDFEHHDPTGDLHGTEEFKEFVQAFRNGFSDLETTVKDLVAESNDVVLHYQMQGTHDGPFMGLEPTGTDVTTSGFVLHRFDAGKVVEVWHYPDAMGLMQQIDADPSAIGQ